MYHVKFNAKYKKLQNVKRLYKCFEFWFWVVEQTDNKILIKV